MLRSGGGERLRSFGLGRGTQPNARVRAGVLITLCGFAIFLVGAAVFQPWVRIESAYRPSRICSVQFIPLQAHIFRTCLGTIG